ncbi:unnamed protein product, partial [Ectocarpus fasciculatus]
REGLCHDHGPLLPTTTQPRSVSATGHTSRKHPDKHIDVGVVCACTCPIYIVLPFCVHLKRYMYQTRPLLVLIVVSAVVTLTKTTVAIRPRPPPVSMSPISSSLSHTPGVTLSFLCAPRDRDDCFVSKFSRLLNRAPIVRHALGSTTNRCYTTLLSQRREDFCRALSEAKTRKLIANNSRSPISDMDRVYTLCSFPALDTSALRVKHKSLYSLAIKPNSTPISNMPTPRN